MKKILSVLAALALISGSAFGAAAISLNNYDANNGAGAPVFYQKSGTLPSGTGFYVEVYAGADANSLAPVTSSAGGSVFALDNTGSFDAGIGIVPGVADNATATFVVHAWKGDNSPTGWQTAAEAVASAAFTQATGNSTPPNIPAPATFNFPTGLIIAAGTTPIVPEPTTIALALFGAAGLLFFRRK